LQRLELLGRLILIRRLLVLWLKLS